MFCLPFWRFQRERISTTSVLPPLPCRRQFPWRFQRFRGGRGAGSSMVKSYRRGGYPGGSGDFEGFRSWEFQEPRTWSKTHLKRSDKCPLRMVGRAPYWNSQGPTRGSSRGAPRVSPRARACLCPSRRPSRPRLCGPRLVVWRPQIPPPWPRNERAF